MGGGGGTLRADIGCYVQVYRVGGFKVSKIRGFKVSKIRGTMLWGNRVRTYRDHSFFGIYIRVPLVWKNDHIDVPNTKGNCIGGSRHGVRGEPTL